MFFLKEKENEKENNKIKFYVKMFFNTDSNIGAFLKIIKSKSFSLLSTKISFLSSIIFK